MQQASRLSFTRIVIRTIRVYTEPPICLVVHCAIIRRSVDSKYRKESTAGFSFYRPRHVVLNSVYISWYTYELTPWSPTQVFTRVLMHHVHHQLWSCPSTPYSKAWPVQMNLVSRNRNKCEGCTDDAILYDNMVFVNRVYPNLSYAWVQSHCSGLVTKNHWHPKCYFFPTILFSTIACHGTCTQGIQVAEHWTSKIFPSRSRCSSLCFSGMGLLPSQCDIPGGMHYVPLIAFCVDGHPIYGTLFRWWCVVGWHMGIMHERTVVYFLASNRDCT